MAKVSNQDIYNQDDNLSMEDYLLGTNTNTINKKTQTYSLGSIFSLFYNFLGFNAFLFTTDTTTYPIGTPGCFFVFNEDDDLTNDFTESRKITFSATDTYNFNVAEYFGIVVNSGKFLFKLINLEDKNNFIFLKPSNFVLGGTGTTFNVDVLAESGLSNGSFVNYKRYLLVLEFAAETFDPADYDLTDFTNTSGNPFITAQDLTDALALLPNPITNHSGLNLDDGTNPHGTTKDDVGLSNVDNTSDVDKPISTATQIALDEINLTLNPDRILSLGTETIDGNNYTYEGYSWQLDGVQINNIENPSIIVIPSATIGYKRNDISVFKSDGTIERIAGTETNGEVVTTPDVPEGTLFYKSYSINGVDIEVEPEPPAIDGAIYKKKIENTRYKSTLSGENIIIPFQAAGQSHYSVTSAALVSVAGFTTAGLTAPMYEGQDVIFENQTGHDITLKDSFGVDTSFVVGADLVVPNEGKIWFRFRNNELELIDKNWFGIQEVVTSENLGEFINGLDSKTDIKDVDEFIISDSEDLLKSKKTRFLDLKTKLKSYFDTFYLSLSIFNDFVTDVFDSLDNKLDKSTTASSVYGTDETGEQTMIPLSELGGGDFKKKIENTRYKSTLSGKNVIIPFQAAGQSHYSVTSAALVSVAGFTTAGLTAPMYEGQDVIFENQTGHDITLKDSFGVDTSFVVGADLVVPNEGKIWFRFRNNELELIDKNWFGIQEVVTSENLGEFINGLDSKTDIKDVDEFIISDSEDLLKSKKTRFLDLKTKLKSYFDTFYLSLSIFNDFVTDVFDSLDNKLDKSTTASSVYGTDETGEQTMIPLSTLVGNQIQQITPVTLLSGGWTLVSGLYQYDYTNINITTTTIVDVIPDNSTIEIVKNAEILPQTNISNGLVTIFSKNLPTSNIVVTLNIFN